MSYSLHLEEPDGQLAVVPDGHDLRGSTYILGGNDQAWLDVTYNYSKHYYRVFGERGIRTLYGLTGHASLALLDDAIGQLNTDVDDDYWKPTEGNARRALENLRLLARACPHAVWCGD